MQDESRVREESGKTAAVFRRGMIDFTHRTFDIRPRSRRYYPALWAGGGSSAFHRRRFLALGGFDAIYSPVYVEDTDLSYRAWKVGWEVLFAPASIVHHKHRASSARRFNSRQLQIMIQRNQFLFLWRNIYSFRLLLAHCAFLPWNCYRLARDYGVSIWLSLFYAAARMSLVEVEKLGGPFRSVRSDQEIFGFFTKPGSYPVRHGAAAEQSAAPRRDSRPPILWLTAYLPHLGRHAGAGRMYQLLSRIAPHYRVTLLSFIETDAERVFVPELETFCERVVALRRVPPLRWQLFPYEPFDEFRTPEMEAALGECLEEDDFALIQLEYSQMACYADKALGIPTLLTKHEVDFAACARRARFEKGAFRKLRWFYNYLQVLDREIQLARRVDAAICMTEPDGLELRKFCASIPVHVINTGVDSDYFKLPDQPAMEPRLVFVGAFQHHPNVDAMRHFCAAVLPRIRARIPETEVIIAGSNPPPEIAALAQTPGITVTGFVPDIRPYMASSSVYIVPLRLGVGIRGKVLEAWSMGMAVVATPVACAGLRYRHDRNLIVADSDESFAEQVIALLNDAPKRRRLGTEGRRVVEEFYGWDVAARQLLDLYDRYCGLTCIRVAAVPPGAGNPASALVGVHDNLQNDSGGALR
jgi:glycosyltransferase involved in cell wall biosynthesis